MPFFRRKVWKRIILTVGTFAGLALALLWALSVYFNWISDRNLQEAIAEADRLDPGWRQEELEAEREEIPDAENAALCVEAAYRLIPTNWPSQQLARKADEGDEENVPLEYSIFELSPEMQLNPEQLEYLRTELQKAAPALAKAHELSQLLRGRFQVNWPRYSIGDRLPAERSRAVANFLHLEGILLAQENKADQALVSARGVLNAGRSIGDEPLMISQLIRMGPELLAIPSIERILAQSQALEKALESAQRLLEDEAAQPLLLIGARGERAQNFQEMERIKTGDVKLSKSGGPSRWYDFGENLSGSLYVRFNQAPLLRLATKCVEIAKLPPEDQLLQLKQLKETETKLPTLVALWLPAYEKFVQACVRNQAYLRCAYVALAVERYRLTHGRWPDSLAEVVPKFLRMLPGDPYNGQPLHYRRTKDGVVIYSVGPDGNDDGGKVDRKNPTALGTDLGFQLWDVPHRRQPWRATKPASEEDK
jgi:hypothetical protein